MTGIEFQHLHRKRSKFYRICLCLYLGGEEDNFSRSYSFSLFYLVLVCVPGKYILAQCPYITFLFLLRWFLNFFLMKENLREQSFFCQVVRHCRHPIIVQLHRGYQCLLQFFSKMFKACCFVCGKILAFCYPKTSYGTIWQNFETMFPE